MDSPVLKIKERLTIEEVVSSYITLEKVGNSLKAKCPFHNEKTPSFFVSKERGTYYCFGCAAGGDIFTFVEEFEGLDFKGALKLLADKAGVSIGSFNKEEEGEKERLYKVMEEATRYFENNLIGKTEIQDYLKSRGCTEKTLKDFRIGFADADWRTLCFYLKKKGFSDKDIELAGLAKSTDKGMYDRFRSRIMFPIMDSSGRVIAFSGRLFGEDEKSAKYLNSPETPIFSKSSVLYGIDKAKDAIRKNNFSILVEGQMDLVLSHQAGWKNTVATSGTALSDATLSKENAISNLGLVRRLSNNIVLAFDADKAGINATSRAGKIALSLGMDVKVAMLPVGVDPADLISKVGPVAWKEAIKQSRHLIEFVLDKILKNNNDIRKIGREIKEQVLPYVNDLSSSIEKSFFIKKISDLAGIPATALWEDLKIIEKELKYEKKEIENMHTTQNVIFRKDYILRKLFGIILWQDTLKEPVINTKEFLQDIKESLNIKIDDTLEALSNNKEDLIFEAEVFYQGKTSLEKDLAELFNNLKEEYLKETLAAKMRELSLSEENKDFEKSSEILKECQIISNKIEDLKNGRLDK
jgi:DNA primase